MPGHESLEGNEAAHAAARDYIHRAISLTGQSPPHPPNPQPLLRYTDILADYRLKRQIFPIPHHQLTRDEATTFRRLQTNTYPHRTLLHAIYPTDYPATCHYCPAPGTLYHQVWECQKTPDLHPIPNPSIQQWTARLTSKDPTFQLDLVQRARAASRSQGIPD